MGMVIMRRYEWIKERISRSVDDGGRDENPALDRIEKNE